MARTETVLPALAPALPAHALEGVAVAVHVLLPAAAASLAAPALAAPAGLRLEPAGLVLLGCGAVVAYAHDRLAPGRLSLDAGSNPRRTRALDGSRAVLGSIALAAAALGLAAFAVATPAVRATALALAAVALAYPLTARLPLGKTIAVAGSWAAGAALLPTGGDPEALLQPPTAALALLVAGASVLCDLKDRDGDRAAGVRSLPALAGPRTASRVALATGAAAAAIAAWAGCWGLALTGAGLAALAARPERLTREIAGPLQVDGWLLLGLGLAALS